MTETVIAVLAALLAIREFMHSRERKDLYSRIMARDLAEYQTAVSARPPPKSGNPIRDNISRHFGAVRKDARND
jgi:hypothetical protein